MSESIVSKFQVGDTVELNSGENNMTVSHLNVRPNMADPKSPIFDGFIVCSWFIKDEGGSPVLQRETFHQDMLKRTP